MPVSQRRRQIWPPGGTKLGRVSLREEAQACDASDSVRFIVSLRLLRLCPHQFDPMPPACLSTVACSSEIISLRAGHRAHYDDERDRGENAMHSGAS